MLLDDFLKKHMLKEVFYTEIKVNRENFIKKMKEISDVSFRTKIFLIADDFLPEKIKYVGNFSKNFIELRERTFKFKRYNAGSLININLNCENDILLIKTSIQGISYFRFFINGAILTLLLFFCLLFLLELNILPILLLLSLIYFYLLITSKRIKANVIRIKKELSTYYNSIQ